MKEEKIKAIKAIGEIKSVINIAVKNERMRIALKLTKRANYLLSKIDNMDSSMILVSSELKMQAHEIYPL